jgi:hypothetical protein
MSTLQSTLLWLRAAWQSRTMWAAAAVVMTGAAVQLGRLVIPPAYSGWVLMVIGVAIGVLRSITTLPLQSKVPGGPPPPAPPAK